jgi:uncharacterized damage-inducible protein DinB
MDGIKHFRTLATYNARLNQQVFSAASALSHDQLHEDRGAFFKSIMGTLNHILVGDILWLRRMYLHHGAENDQFSQLVKLADFPAVTSLNQILFEDFSVLKEKRFAVDAIISLWINEQFKEADLESNFCYQNIKGESSTKNFGEVLSHIFNHQTHHRGQAFTLLIQSGVDIGVTDYLMDIDNA